MYIDTAKMLPKKDGIKIKYFLGTKDAIDKGKSIYQGWKVVLIAAKNIVANARKKEIIKTFSQLISFLNLFVKNIKTATGKNAPVENFTPTESI